MNVLEIKMRCVEAAAKASYPSSANGHAAGALEAATVWFNWITSLSSDVADKPSTITVEKAKAMKALL